MKEYNVTFLNFAYVTRNNKSISKHKNYLNTF